MHTREEQNEVQTTDTIPFDAAVAEIKDILAKLKEAAYLPLRLGEIAHKVQPEYGDRSTIEELAKQSGIELSTLENYRSVYRAWKDKLPPGAIFAFTVLKELAAVPNRAELLMAEPNMSKRRAEVLRVLKDHPAIISAYPNLTCSDDAREFRSKYDAGDPTWRTEPTEQADDDLAETDDDQDTGTEPSAPTETDRRSPRRRTGASKRGSTIVDKSKTWLNKLAARNTDITGDAQTRHEPLTPEQRRGLVVALAAAPSLPEQMRKASDELREHADWFDSVKEEAAKTVEGRIARSPKPASSEPAQASA
jgi:hypothetical protein